MPIEKSDLISEEEYTLKMREKVSTKPENDSPGDSEEDATTEFMLGVDYVPAEAGPEDEEAESEDEAPALKITKEKPVVELPESAKVVSSDLPSHRMDREGNSDTH